MLFSTSSDIYIETHCGCLTEIGGSTACQDSRSGTDKSSKFKGGWTSYYGIMGRRRKGWQQLYFAEQNDHHLVWVRIHNFQEHKDMTHFCIYIMLFKTINMYRHFRRIDHPYGSSVQRKIR